MKMWLRSLGLGVVHRFGMKIKDAESGRALGRVLIVPWKGRIHVIGLQRNARPLFLPQTRLTYWKQELAFQLHESPDFSSKDSAERLRAARSEQSTSLE